MDSNLISIVCTVIQTLAVVVTCGLGLRTWRSDVKNKNIRHIQSLPLKMMFDPDVDEILSVMDYGKPWYGPEFHNSGELERKIDKTLLFLDNICFQKYKFNLQDTDIYAFNYNIGRCITNHDVQSYLFNLYHWCKKLNSDFPYKYLLRYGEESGDIKKNFYDVTERGHSYIDGRLNF
mgnify:CR=1 FL=1